MSTHETSRSTLAPDKTPLTESQATVLGSLTGIDASKLKGLSVSEIATEYQWQIDPNLLLFTRVCGQVVVQNPTTGVQSGVPYATVYAEETVCSLFGFFPGELPWAWFFPFHCITEVVGQTTTDDCGNFCIWVPRFIIVWILRFRLERVCYLQLFNKPTVGSVIAYLQGNPIGPDPGPEAQAAVTLIPGTTLYQQAEQLLGPQVARQLAAKGGSKTFGSAQASQSALLARPAFPATLPPALPKELRAPVKNASPEEHRKAVQSTLANNLGLDASQIEGLDLNRYFGPFFRCFDILVPEWVPIFEVPDISFRVTQDVSGTGTQTVIYSGGLFDVPWGTGTPSNVTLIASPIAISSTNCETPNVPCGDVPSLEFVGLMPLENPPGPAAPYINTTTGYATRPNPPHPGGTLSEAGVPPGFAPFTGTLQLYGCTEVDGAAYYRLVYTYTPPGGSPTISTPFTGLTWPLNRLVGFVLEEEWPVADANGWYPVIDPSDGWNPNSMVLEWDTVNSPINANGLYNITLEVADGSKTLLASSSAVALLVDNTIPAVSYSALWSFTPDFSSGTPVATNDCSIIHFGSNPYVYIQLTYSVTANNLRQVQVGASGCGTPTLTSAVSTTQHWYEDQGDNTFSNVATYQIATSAAGVYSFGVYADTRAFNPAGSDAGATDDWNYNPPAGYYKWTDPSFAIAIVP